MIRCLAISLIVCALCALDLTERDKQIHAAAGCVIAATVSSALSEYRPSMPAWQRYAAGVGASLVAGIAKEVADKHGSGTCDRDDALATVLGGAVGASITFAWEF